MEKECGYPANCSTSYTCMLWDCGGGGRMAGACKVVSVFHRCLYPRTLTLNLSHAKLAHFLLLPSTLSDISFFTTFKCELFHHVWSMLPPLPPKKRKFAAGASVKPAFVYPFDTLSVPSLHNKLAKQQRGDLAVLMRPNRKVRAEPQSSYLEEDELLESR